MVWGRILLRAGAYTGALEKLDGAIDVYRRHGAGQVWIDRVEADRRRALDTASRMAEPHAKATTTSQPSCCFYHEGDYWLIASDGKTARLKDAKGFHYIACLLRHPGVEIAVMQLVAPTIQANGAQIALAENEGDPTAIHSDLGDAGPLLDATAKMEYARRLRELHEELEEAQRFNDPGKAALLCRESEALMAQLNAATGLHGDRRVASHVERARSAVAKRIRHAIRQIENHNPQLASFCHETR